MLNLREPGEELDELARRVIGAAIEVHRALGPGFSESVYEEALCIELTAQRISFVRQPIIRLEYRGLPVGEGRLDLLVGDRLIVELKAVDALISVQKAQALTYLRITRHPLALLINFNVPVLHKGVKRIVLS